MSNAMTRSELVRRLLLNHPALFLKDANKLVETILDEIGNALERGDRVELRGFGSFSVRHRKPRMARNPKTNEAVPLGERSAPYFRAGKELRERINKAAKAQRAFLMQVKICGLTTREAIITSVDAGADYLGFVFVQKSPRNITPQQATIVSADLPAKKVAVVVNATNDELQAIYENLKPDYFQLHGDESPASAVAIRETFSTPIIKAIGVSTAEDVKKAEAYKEVAEYILFDAKPPKDAQMTGGLGRSFNWNLLATNHKPQTTSFFLSGGLTPESVADAIRITKPFAVDVSSGVESSSGVKDLAKIKAFIANAKNQKTKI